MTREFGRLLIEVEGLMFDLCADADTVDYFALLRDRADFQGLSDLRDALVDRLSESRVVA